MRKLIMIAAFAIPIYLVACGGGNQKDTNSDANSADTMAQSEPITPPASSTVSTGTNTIELTANDQMKYNLNEIRVKAGEKVTITLKNEGTMPIEAMGHNFVLLALGTDIEKFALQSMVSKETDYIPATLKSSILAHTKILGPGNSETVEFTINKGEYDYICSFPGHHATMRGKLIAE